MTIHKEFARKITPRLKPLSLLIGSGLLTMASLNAMAETGNPRVNQLGYVPNGIKTATYKTSSTSAQTWQLKQNGSVVASGQTTPLGTDASSGDNLQQIDLSSVTATGTGFSLTVGSDTSYNFSIATNAFNAALYDSLKYFYHNRSGIAIQTQYTGGGNGSFASNSKWSRQAGHLNVSPNKGDVNVPCWTGTCNYSLNVSKGWYDAGDHGKYVVNGGISVWTLLNIYERSLYLGNNLSSLGDGKLNIPESANGIPDVLDEARWELEFLLGMQVPTGQTKAGMVHHKMHDVGWTGFPLAPHEDPQERALVPPSTAATLNVAAVAAQAARIWKDLDSGFAATCLTAAQRAWEAAQANPSDIYSGNYDNGGGGYGDKTVADEFYWAAAELYLTTGDSKYLSTLNSRSITQTNFGWADTDLAGLISLAIVPASQTASLRSAAQQKIVTIANSHITTQNSSGYPAPSSNMEYYWGSNGGVANKLILMGLAYDFTKNDTYAKGVGKGLGYLFGQNALSTSFVTGEGSKTVTQPHHRFWANATNGSYPVAPPGALSGGPNSSLDDPKSAAALAGCVSKPATCWMDNIEAYAVNEITINWNAPLAWDLAFYNDYATSNNTSSSSSVASSSVVSSSVRSSSSSSVVSSSSIRSSSSSVISSSSIRSSSSVVSSSSIRSSSSVSSSSSSTNTSVGPRLDNPFSGARWYVDPVWSAKAAAEPGGSAVANNNTAVWMDRIGAIEPTDGTYGLRDHLDAALAQNANVIQVVVYDLPNRDCKALASNGELKQSAEGSLRYRTEYVDKIASIFSDSKYASLRIIAIIEPDSLPNLVTNLNDPDCQAAADATYGYVANTRYTLSKLYAISNVYSYVDIGHSGWLGWDDNFGKSVTLIADAIKGATGGVNSIAGFVSNTAGYTPLYEPFLDSLSSSALPGSGGGTQVRQANFYEWNPYFSEVSFVQAWRSKMIAAGFPSSIGMLIDTSRNGWGGANRPTAQSTSTVLDTFVDQSRIDKRTHRGNWCNQKGGIGERPQAAPVAGIDAYVWVKPPGESDGAASQELSYDPQDPAKGFDRMCDPTYTYAAGNFTVGTGALANAPVAGRWFSSGFQTLLNNAYPAAVVTSSSSRSSSSVVSSSSVRSSSSSVVSSSVVSSSSIRSSSSVASSSSVVSSSSVASSSSVRSSSSSASGQQCNWYGTLYPLCVNTTGGWGYENGKSCISRSTCVSQPAPYGIVGDATSSSSSSSSAANRAPTAVITYTQAQACPQQSFTIYGTGSTDPDGDALTYDWVVAGSGSSQTYSGVSINVGFRPVTTYTVTLTVKDGKGGVSTATKDFYHSASDNCGVSSSSSSVRSSSSSVVSSSSSVRSSSSSVVSSSSSVSSSSVASNGAKCAYVVTNQWNNGFTGAIRITNNGNSAINGWNVSWSYSDGSKITSSWNGSLSGSNPYSASGVNWNSTIQPGQTAEFGFQGTKGNGSAQVPTVTGSICQ